jgi:hypothetical protein
VPPVSIAGLPPPPPPHAVRVDADAPSASVSLGDAMVGIGGAEDTYTPMHTAASAPDGPPHPPCAPTENANAQAKTKAKAKAQLEAEAEKEEKGNVEEAEVRPRYRPPPPVPPPRAIALGTYRVAEVQLWVMGSRGRRGEYVSCGGVRLE